MDCLQVCEILSIAHDGEPVDATLLAEARAHATGCAECQRFAELLERSGSATPPRAPAALVERLEALAAPVAAELRDVAPAGSLEPELTPSPLPRPRNTWMPRLTAFAAAAAVILLAFTVGTIALIGTTRQAGTGSASTEELRATDSPVGTESYDTGAADSAAATLAEASAPAYITFGEEVWVLVDAAAPAPSALVTAGAITSTLDDGATGERPVWTTDSDDTVLFARAADGRYLSFVRVLRLRGRTAYTLVSGTPITAFGQWPTLPERFEQPTATDGSPTFRRFGFDDAHLDIYVPPGGRIEDGFAVAPGTATSDPAAGNPGWTWWQALD